MFYAIGFVALMGIMFIYGWIMSWFFGPIQIDSWGGLIGGYILGYLVIAVVLNIKYYFKSKVKPEYALTAQSTDDKLAMLKILLDDGVLTQEEFDGKKEML